MAGGHVHALFVHGDGRLHQLPAQAKVAAHVLFVVAVVATPRHALWAFGVHAAAVAAVATWAGLRLRSVAARMVIELPFVAFAVFLPLVGRGERIDVAGLSLSVAGLWGAWNILAKGTIGVAASVVLAATTPVTELLHGLERLRLPRTFTAIAGFMVRYLDLTTDELHRMNVARQSRGHDPRFIWQARAVASSAGALFVRSFERGERVHLAMVSRGYTGALPVVRDEAGPTGRQWATCLALPALAAAVAGAAWVTVT